RLDEPRKGLHVLMDAVPHIRAQYPGLRVLVAGRGDLAAATAHLGEHAVAVEELGGITDAQKAALFASVDAYIAPQTAGESFGIVRVEAMSADTSVSASDLNAFRRVLDDGGSGFLFSTGDPASLAETVLLTLGDPAERARRRAHADTAARRFDWDEVAARILDVYAMVTAHGSQPSTGWLRRLFGPRSAP